MGMITDAENIAAKDIESDIALPTSVCDGNDSLGGPRSSRESGSKKRNSSKCSVGSLLDTPNDNLSKVPEVEFKKGHSEKVVNHLAAVINRALDSDDVGLKGKGTTNKADTETSEGAVVGRSNDAMDVDDISETSF